MRARMVMAAGALALASCYSPNLKGSFFCHVNDSPACPDGQVCMLNAGSTTEGTCVGGGMVGGGGGGQAIMIPKSGSYSGPHSDPMLNDATTCPDVSLEPNDSTMTAIPAPVPTPDDATTPKITHLAVCPTGPNPATGQHDVDYYSVDTTKLGAGTLTLQAEIFYDISYGDLDVAIVDGTGRILAADGSAATNGCTAAAVPPGQYYVVVVGANNTDSNRYELRVRSYTMSHQCPTPGMPMDMGL